jgi:hypothetical protein
LGSLSNLSGGRKGNANSAGLVLEPWRLQVKVLGKISKESSGIVSDWETYNQNANGRKKVGEALAKGREEGNLFHCHRYHSTPGEASILHFFLWASVSFSVISSAWIQHSFEFLPVLNLCSQN